MESDRAPPKSDNLYFPTKHQQLILTAPHIYIYIYIYTDTHTYIYMYIYIVYVCKPCFLRALRPFSMKWAPLLMAAMPIEMPSDGVVAVPPAPAPAPEEVFGTSTMAQMLVGKTDHNRRDFLQQVQNKVSHLVIWWTSGELLVNIWWTSG